MLKTLLPFYAISKIPKKRGRGEKKVKFTLVGGDQDFCVVRKSEPSGSGLIWKSLNPCKEVRARGTLGHAKQLGDLGRSGRRYAGEWEVAVEAVRREELLEEGGEQAHVKFVVHTSSVDRLAEEGTKGNPWNLLGRNVAASTRVQVQPVVDTVKRSTLVLLITISKYAP